MDELIQKYAGEIRAINSAKTEGDSTWEGLLFRFAQQARVEIIAEWREGRECYDTPST